MFTQWTKFYRFVYFFKRNLIYTYDIYILKYNCTFNNKHIRIKIKIKIKLKKLLIIKISGLNKYNDYDIICIGIMQYNVRPMRQFITNNFIRWNLEYTYIYKAIFLPIRDIYRFQFLNIEFWKQKFRHVASKTEYRRYAKLLYRSLKNILFTINGGTNIFKFKFRLTLMPFRFNLQTKETWSALVDGSFIDNGRQTRGNILDDW